MLPNFLVIGVQKGGTTTLWDALRKSPDVFFSDPRETNFFIFDFEYSFGMPYYERRFFPDTGGAKAVGEKTPDYLFYPPCARRIRTALGEHVRLIAVLRSPAARANSHHRHNFMLYREHLSFQDAIQAEPTRTGSNIVKQTCFGYMKKGDYLPQIARYLELFSREQLLVLKFEDLRDRQQETIERVCEFLDVRCPVPFTYIWRGEPKQQDLAVKRGAEGVEVHFERTKEVVKKPSSKMINFARAMNRTLPDLKRLARDEEQALNRAYYGDNIKRLGDLINKDLEDWLA